MNANLNITIHIGPLTLCYRGDDALLSEWEEAAQWISSQTSTESGEAYYQVLINRIPSVEPQGTMLHDYLGVQVYREQQMECRYYYHSVDPSKQLFARSYQADDYTIILSILKSYNLSTQSLWSMIGIEHLLLRHNAIILHSASVIYNGQAILFSAPSGTGKSTQADLWKKYSGAVGFNGDRNLLWKKGGKWFVSGSPWHGTSPDCINSFVPLRAIAVVRQAETDRIRPLTLMEKVMDLHSESTVNRWNQQDVAHAFDLAEDLAGNADIVGLDCTMKPSAVTTLKDYLEPEKEKTSNGTI